MRITKSHEENPYLTTADGLIKLPVMHLKRDGDDAVRVLLQTMGAM